MKYARRSITDIDVAPRDFVQAFARGLEIIVAFDEQHPRLTLSEAAARTGMTPAAARRFLLTLVREGYALFDGKHFALAPRVLDLGYAFLSSEGVGQSVEMVLKDLSDRTGESCSAAVLDGDEVVYVGRVNARRIMTINLRVGSRLPALYTSTGRTLLANLPTLQAEAILAKSKLRKLTPRSITDPSAFGAIFKRIRTSGWAIVNQELELGLITIAVPVRDRNGKVTAAINVTSHVSRSSPQYLVRGVLPLLQRAALSIAVARTEPHANFDA